MTADRRPRLAVYWGSGCGGCEMAFLDLGGRLPELVEIFNIVFFPLLVDVRRRDLESFGDRSVDLCLFTGAIRTEDDLEMARTLRRVSRVMVAHGACAQLGSVLALADHGPPSPLLAAVSGPLGTIGREGETLPQPRTETGGGWLELPPLLPTVGALDTAVTVDAVIPGCPPEAPRLMEAIETLAAAVLGGTFMPEPGAVLGASDTSLCEECPRERPTGRITTFRRQHEVDPDATRCLLDQGLMCSGPATRGGCGALCPEAAVGCRGCYGPLPGVVDHGARMIGALAALLDGDGEAQPDPTLRPRHTDPGPAFGLLDPVGTLYRYSLATSLVARLAAGSPVEEPCAD